MAEPTRPHRRGIFSEDIAGILQVVGPLSVGVATFAGGNWAFVAYAYAVPLLIAYRVWYGVGDRFDDRVSEASATSIFSIVATEQNESRSPERLRGRHVRNILWCGAAFLFLLIWMGTGTILRTSPSSGVRLTQLVGYVLAPQLVMIDPAPFKKDVQIPPEVVIPVIPIANPVEQMRAAGLQASAERDAAIAERDALRQQLARGALAGQRTLLPPTPPPVSTNASSSPAAPPPAPAPTPDPPPPAAASQPPPSQQPAEQAASTTRSLTNEEQDAVDLLNERIAAGSAFVESLQKTQNVPSNAMKNELTVWVSLTQARLRGNRILGPLTNAAFMERNGNWDDPLMQLNAMLGYLESRRDDLLRPTRTNPPDAPTNVRITP